ncbi:cell division control protein 24 [Monosporozyma servazzii]
MNASASNSRKNTIITNRSTNGSSIMITSSNDASASHISNVMNSSVTLRDSLYYICLNVKKRLDNIPQLQPYLNLAYSSSELLSERQSLLLSQRQQQLLQTNNTAMSATPTTSRISTLSTNSIIKDDFSLDSNNNNTMEDTLLTFSMGILPISMDCDPVTQLSQLFQQGSPLCIIFNLVKPQFKLPVVSSDDLKICKKSIYDFILGCKQHFAFNDEELFTISDVFANSTNHLINVIEVVSTIMDSAPDIFPSKDKIQEQIDKDIINKMNKHSQKYDDYTKIIREFVNTERKYVHDLEILETYKTQLLNANIITSEELYMLFPNLSDAIDFQRRFLISLEINSLVAPTKQRIGALFMHSKWFFKLYEPWSIGQNAAIDFLTTTLENLNKSNFNEPSSFVISNKLELQSFLYKPVQRLCRYPLLLKELTSCNILSGSSPSEENLKSMTASSTSSTSSSTTTTTIPGVREKESNPKSKELEVALDISKSIARSINENQRRTENHQVVKKLYGRVINWKGYRIAKFGELLYFDNVFISTNNSNDQEREFEVYLFEKIIILFQQVNNSNGNGSGKNKTSSLMLKKKTTSSSLSSTSTLTLSSLNHSSLLSGSNNNNNNNNSNNSNNNGNSNSNYNTTSSFTTTEPKLDLRGRIMIMNLSQISPMSNRSLSITWESIKEQGNFILKFKNEETRDNWSSCLQSLVRSMKSESYKSNASETSFISSSSMRNSSHNNTTLVESSAHDSISSFGNSAMKHISDMLPKQKKHVSNFENEYRAVSENYKHSIPETSILIRISFNSDFYTLLMELNSSMDEIYEMITKKLNHVGKISKIKYQDEDGDYVILASEDDWLVVKDMLRENNERMLNVVVFANE